MDLITTENLGKIELASRIDSLSQSYFASGDPREKKEIYAELYKLRMQFSRLDQDEPIHAPHISEMRHTFLN